MSACGSDTAATVLLMESQPVVRAAVSAVLNGAGFNVIETQSLHEA